MKHFMKRKTVVEIELFVKVNESATQENAALRRRK